MIQFQLLLAVRSMLLMNSFYCAFVFCSDQYIDIYGRDWMEVQNERKQYNLPWDICKYQTMFKQTYLYKWLKCDKSNTQKTKSKLQLIPFFFFSSNDDFEHSKDLAGGVNFHLFMIRFSLQITSEFIRDESKPTGVEMGQLAIWLNKILTKNFLVCFFSKKIKFTFPSNLFQLLFVLFVFYISKHFFFYFEWEGTLMISIVWNSSLFRSFANRMGYDVFYGQHSSGHLIYKWY